MSIIVPVQGEADLLLALTVDRDVIVSFKDIDEVLRVFLTFVFYAGVVDNKGKLDQSPIVYPEARENQTLSVALYI